MKRMTAEEVANGLFEKATAHRRSNRITEFDTGFATASDDAAHGIYNNLVPQWQDQPDEDTHARCPWWWCEDLGKDSPPQLLRFYRPLKATLLGDLTVDMQAPKEWTRWTVAGWVPLVGRVCSIGERPS